MTMPPAPAGKQYVLDHCEQFDAIDWTKWNRCIKNTGKPRRSGAWGRSYWLEDLNGQPLVESVNGKLKLYGRKVPVGMVMPDGFVADDRVWASGGIETEASGFVRGAGHLTQWRIKPQPVDQPGGWISGWQMHPDVNVFGSGVVEKDHFETFRDPLCNNAIHWDTYKDPPEGQHKNLGRQFAFPGTRDAYHTMSFLWPDDPEGEYVWWCDNVETFRARTNYPMDTMPGHFMATMEISPIGDRNDSGTMVGVGDGSLTYIEGTIDWLKIFRVVPL